MPTGWRCFPYFFGLLQIYRDNPAGLALVTPRRR